MTRIFLALTFLALALTAFGCGGSEEVVSRDAPTHQSADLGAEADEPADSIGR